MLKTLEVNNSTLIKKVEYDIKSRKLTIFFTSYYILQETYLNVIPEYFKEFSESKSLGKFYLSNIKPFFKTEKSHFMAKSTKTQQQPEQEKKKFKGVNRIGSDEIEYVDIDVNLSKLNKDLLVESKNGVIAKLRLRVLPKGDVSNYQQLGMITQSVPKVVYEKEKNLPKEEKTKGEIVGNAQQLVWEGQEGFEDTNELGLASQDALDDLPF